VTVDKLAGNAVETTKIKDLNVTTGKLANSAVTDVKLATSAVTTAKIADNTVTTAKIANGAVTYAKLGKIQSITLDTGDTISYSASTNELKLNVSGCTSVALCPIVYGTASSISGTYPKGTIYIQYQA